MAKHKHGMKHTHTEHHEDGSHTVKHEMLDGSSKGHAIADDAGLMAHMGDALGQPAPQGDPAQAAPPALAGAAPPAALPA
jgi:hypothetical protein